MWSSFKVALQDASGQLLFLPWQKEADWITVEVKNLSRRRKEAWLRLQDTSSDDDGRSIDLDEFRRFRRLTKARNAWWSAKAVGAENKAKLSQQLGCSGSLIKDLRLLKNQAFKPSSSSTSLPRTSPFSPVTSTSFNAGQNTLQMCLTAVLRSVSLTLRHCQTSLQPHYLTDFSFQTMKIYPSLSLRRKSKKLLDNYEMAGPLELMVYQPSC